MEVPRDHHFRNALHNLETQEEFSNEEINETAKTIFENSDLLKGLDPSKLTRIKVKMLKSGVSENDKVINLINHIYGEYSGKIDKQIKSMASELHIFKVLGSLKKSLGNVEYLRIYQYRTTGEYDLAVNKNYASKNFLQTFYRPAYTMNDNPSDIINIFFKLKETLENKIATLMTDLKKEGISGNNLEKGLSLLKTLDETLFAAMEGITNLQKSGPYESLYLKLDKLKFDFTKFQENIDAEIVHLTGLEYLANDDFEESELLKESFKTLREMQSQIPELEGDSYYDSNLQKTQSDQIHVDKFIQNFSRYLSDKSQPKFQKYELILEKSASPEDLNNMTDNFILINGHLSTYPAGEISTLIGENINKNPCTQMIAKMISPEMFKSLLSVAEAQSSSIFKDLIQITELNRFVEINVDKYDNLEIVLKVMCGYSANKESNVDDFMLAKRSLKIPLSDFKIILEDGDLEFKAKNFEIIDFVSPEVKVEDFNFHDTNYEKLSSALLENFSPQVKTIPLQYKKMLDKEIEKNSDLSLAETLVDKEFISCFENVCILHGTQLNPEAVLILAKSWEDKEFRQIFREFIHSVQECQKANLKILDTGLLPTISLDYNLDMYSKLDKNFIYFTEFCPPEKVKFMKDFLYFTAGHGFINNSQIVEDWIGLEFRSDNMTEGTVSRAQKFLKSAENFGHELDDEINFLNEQLKSGSITSSDDTLETKKKISELIRIQGYWKEGYMKSTEFPLLLCNLWIPPISSTDDITVLKRLISLRTKEGKKLENTSTLNLVGIIPVNPTLKQREQISVFMKACDSFISQNSEFINKLDSDFEIPSEILPTLDVMDWLSEGKKTAIFIEMIRFSYDVNYHYIMNMMKI